MSRLRRTPFYRALHRPNLFLGGERELVMTMGILCAGLIISSQNWVASIVGVLIWLVCLGFFRLMAKADPYMSRIYLRHMKYQAYYPARSTPWRVD